MALIERHESMAEYIAHARTKIDMGNHAHSDRSWDLGVKAPEAMRRAVSGDADLAAQAVSALDKLSESLNSVDRHAWISDVTGARVDVPAYLAGRPDSMRRRVKRDSQVRHATIHVELQCSAGIDARDMIKRGVTILGLLQTLQASGVEVDVYGIIAIESSHAHGNGDYIQVIRLETRPLDLSTVAFALAHPAFARNVCYEVGRQYGYRGGWPATHDRVGGGTAWVEFMRKTLDMDPADIYVPAAHYNDAAMRTPEKWIATHLSQAVAA